MNLKYLTEQRAEKLGEMKSILELAKAEKRALTEDEQEKFDEKQAEVKIFDATINAAELVRKEEIKMETKKRVLANAEDPKQESIEEYEVRAFEKYIRTGKIETRANMTFGDNGAVVPQTIAQRIIERVKEICPVYSLAEIYNVKGTLVVPYYGEDGTDITCAYATEFSDLTSTTGKFTSIQLSEYLAGALTKISEMLINNSDFNIVDFVVTHMAKAIALFLEGELLSGSGTGACQGILTGATNVTTSNMAGLIKSDDLIDVQESIPDVYQNDAVWIMNRTTRAAIRKLKDGQGVFLLNPDFTAKWGYTLLGKPVYTSDNMPAIASAAKAVIYGDLTGLTVKVSEQVSIKILNELYAAQHAVGVVGWLEVDSKVTDQQKLAVLEIA